MSGGAQTILEGGAGDRTTLSVDRLGVRFALGGRRPVNETILDFGCIVVLAVAALLQGIVVAFDLPSHVELLGDAFTAGLLLWAGVSAVRRGTVELPYLAIAFLVVVLVAALRSEDVVRLLISIRNFVLFPALALALAAHGTRDRRVRMVVLAVVALVAVEFLVTIVQSLTVADIDLVVGTFGNYSGPSTAFVVVAGACLALGVYAAGAGPAWWLLFASIVPLFSIWAGIRIVPLVVPMAGAAVAVAAWWAWGTPRLHGKRTSRSLAVAGTTLACTVALFAGYAIAKPFDFQLFTNSEERSAYLQSADITSDSQVGETRAGRKVRTEGQSRRANEIPGRLEQYRTAERLIERSPFSFLFGAGLGATTYAVNLGVDEPDTRGARLAGYSDFGTLLVELGWLGVLTAAACAVALGLGSIAAARQAASGSWTRALLVAYPGVLVAMSAGAIHGSPFRNLGSATIFWMLTGLVLAFVLQRRAMPASEGTDPAIQSIVRRRPSRNSTEGS